MMGIHRNVIHPKFGNFILLGTVLIGVEASEYDRAIDYNPCLSCKLCVAACPVGAIGPDGHFDFASCYTHNYREFMGGFGDWAEHVADAGSPLLAQTGKRGQLRSRQRGAGRSCHEPRVAGRCQSVSSAARAAAAILHTGARTPCVNRLPVTQQRPPAAAPALPG